MPEEMPIGHDTPTGTGPDARRKLLVFVGAAAAVVAIVVAAFFVGGGGADSGPDLPNIQADTSAPDLPPPAPDAPGSQTQDLASR